MLYRIAQEVCAHHGWNFPLTAERAGEIYDHLQRSIPNLIQTRENFAHELALNVLFYLLIASHQRSKGREADHRYLALYRRWRELREDFDDILNVAGLTDGLILPGDNRVDPSDLKRWLIALENCEDHLGRVAAGRQTDRPGKVGRHHEYARERLIRQLGEIYYKFTGKRAPKYSRSGPFVRLVEDVLDVVEPSGTQRAVGDMVRRAYEGGENG